MALNLRTTKSKAQQIQASQTKTKINGLKKNRQQKKKLLEKKNYGGKALQKNEDLHFVSERENRRSSTYVQG